MYRACSDHDKFEVMWMPKNLNESTISTSELLTISVEGADFDFLKSTTISFVLLTFRTRSLLAHQLTNCFTSSLYRVRTYPGKPGIYWNLIIGIPGLEYTGISSKVLENTGI